MRHPETHLGPAVAGSNLVGLREGDSTAPPVTDDNPRVVRQVTTLGHHCEPAQHRHAHLRVNIARRRASGAAPPAGRPPATALTRWLVFGSG
jgi:hypothetical protein